MKVGILSRLKLKLITYGKNKLKPAHNWRNYTFVSLATTIDP